MSGKRNSQGRIAEHDPDYVRDISHEIAVQRYLARPTLLPARCAKDPAWFGGIRDRAVEFDSVVRTVLTVLRDNPDIRRIEELTYKVYRARMLRENDEKHLLRTSGEAKLRRDSACYLPLVREVVTAKALVDDLGHVTTLVEPVAAYDTSAIDFEDDSL